ncbi:24396_t:CDS:1, partial [Dentiscutata erythropus]
FIKDKPLTKAANFHRFGIIIAEISTSKRPFDGCEINTKLVKIISKDRNQNCIGSPNSECSTKQISFSFNILHLERFD